MNHFILQATISSIQTFDKDGKVRATATAAIPALGEEKDDYVIEVVSFGQTAEKFKELNDPCSLILQGSIKVDREAPNPIQMTAERIWEAPGAEPVNSCCLVGRAGRDPKVRYFESGKVVANLTLAVNRWKKDDPADWFNLEIWGKQAQVAADYVRKGSLLGIIGSFKLDRWTDSTSGEERSKPVIRVDRLELLGRRPDTNGPEGSPWGGGEPSTEDVPF